MTIHQARATLYFALSDFGNSRAEGERLLALARRTGDLASEEAALAGMGFASFWAHDFDQALAFSIQAGDLVRERNAPPVLAGGLLTIAFVHAVTARINEARPEFEQALAISRSTDDVVTQAFSLGFAALIQNWEGAYAAGVTRVAEGVRIAREHNLLVPLLWTLWISGVVLIGKGDYDEALRILEEGLALCDKAGDEVMRHRVLNTLGWLYAECGDLDSAADFSRRGAEGARKRGDPETVANPEINLGDVLIVKGDLALAQEVLGGVLGLVNDPATSEWMRWRYSTHLFASLADLWLARGDLARARQWADQCLDIATRTGARKNLVKGWRLKSEIAMAGRRWDEAETAVRQALTIAQAIGNPTQLWRTHETLGRLHAGAKRPDLARQAYQDARRVLDGMKSRLQDARLRASIDKAPWVRRIDDLSGPAE
jgi:tetratricopeptide (TPR) repeat protein